MGHVEMLPLNIKRYSSTIEDMGNV